MNAALSFPLLMDIHAVSKTWLPGAALHGAKCRSQVATAQLFVGGAAASSRTPAPEPCGVTCVEAGLLQLCEGDDLEGRSPWIFQAGTKADKKQAPLKHRRGRGLVVETSSPSSWAREAGGAQGQAQASQLSKTESRDKEGLGCRSVAQHLPACEALPRRGQAEAETEERPRRPP